jgi:hypothetical protein
MVGEYHVGGILPGEHHVSPKDAHRCPHGGAKERDRADLRRHGSRQRVRYSGSGGHAHAEVLLILHNAHKHTRGHTTYHTQKTKHEIFLNLSLLGNLSLGNPTRATLELACHVCHCRPRRVGPRKEIPRSDMSAEGEHSKSC